MRKHWGQSIAGTPYYADSTASGVVAIATSRTGTATYKRWRRAVLHRGQQDGITHCPNCRVPLDYTNGRRPNSAEPDHIIPHSLGGTDTIDNGRVLCRHCNQSRGNGQRAAQRQHVETIDFT